MKRTVIEEDSAGSGALGRLIGQKLEAGAQ